MGPKHHAKFHKKLKSQFLENLRTDGRTGGQTEGRVEGRTDGPYFMTEAGGPKSVYIKTSKNHQMSRFNNSKTSSN